MSKKEKSEREFKKEAREATPPDEKKPDAPGKKKEK